MAIFTSKSQCCCGCTLRCGSQTIAVLMLLGGLVEFYIHYLLWNTAAKTFTEVMMYFVVDFIVIGTGLTGIVGSCQHNPAAIKLFRNLYLGQMVAETILYLGITVLLLFSTKDVNGSGTQIDNGKGTFAALLAATLIHIVIYLIIAVLLFSVVDSYNDVVMAGGDGTEMLKADDIKKQMLKEESDEEEGEYKS